MKSTTYIVGYRDSDRAHPKYFGPFVSQQTAEFFMAALPEPLRGGFKRSVVLQPFTAQEGHTVNKLLQRERLEMHVAA